MNSIFILDACALIALLAGEPGAEKVRDIVQDAINGEKIVIQNSFGRLHCGCRMYYRKWNFCNF